MLFGRLRSLGLSLRCFGLMLLAGCNAGDGVPEAIKSERNASFDNPDTRVTSLERMTNRLGMAFRLIPEGEFAMGTEDVSPFGEFAACEQPQHVVRLTRPFWMSECEVTVGQFRRFVEETSFRTEAERTGQGVNGLNLLTGEVQQHSERIWSSPGFLQTEQHPVVGVSWSDAHDFCVWLSQKEERVYRLPTEAEWEYACRAGSKTPFASGDSLSPMIANVGDVALRAVFARATSTANWSDQYPFTAHVGSCQPNRFGLYDMHGNVGEWCQDWFDSEYYASSPAVDPPGPAAATNWRVVRGGSWYNSPVHCRSAGRHDGLPTAPSTTNGFRVVLEADQAREPSAAH